MYCKRFFQLQGCFMECELLRSPMISYRSLLYNTTVLYDIYMQDICILQVTYNPYIAFVSR